MIALGVTYDSTISRSTKNISKEQQNLAMKRMEITKMGLDRYSTTLGIYFIIYRIITTSCYKCAIGANDVK